MIRSPFALRWAAVAVACAWVVLFLSSDFFDRVRRERVLLAFGAATVAAPFRRTVLASDCPPAVADCQPAFRQTPVLALPVRHLTSAAVVLVAGLLFAAAWRERKRPVQ
jgi:hypothetical protein